MRALITGVSGFVGSFLSEMLLQHGREVIGISRTKPNNKLVQYFECDIRDSANLENILRASKPDEIYHLAGPSQVRDFYEKPTEVYNIIVNGTINLYESIRKLDLDTKVLFVGSAEVYGYGKESPLNENDLLQPTNPYAGAKACADLISEQYFRSYNLRIIRVRPFNHTGPGQSADFVCSDFAKQIAEMEVGAGREFIHVGNINVKRDFLDVRDVVNAYFLLMQRGKFGEVYNVSSNQEFQINYLLESLIQFSNLDRPRIKIDKEKLREKETNYRVGDNTKLRLHTGWIPKYTMLDTMKDILDYWREYCAKVR